MRRARRQAAEAGVPLAVKDWCRKAIHPYDAVLLVTLDGNIQDPIAARPSGKRAKVRYGLCGHWYAIFNLIRRFPRVAAETSSHFIQGLRRVFHRCSFASPSVCLI